MARFRVNIFIQRGSCAVVMRVISTADPGFRFAAVARQLADVSSCATASFWSTGPAGSGKSSTLAVLLDCINREKYYHIITIEDPIEFLHSHKCSTIHQRELHSDTPSFAYALRSALRQAPKVILVGEMRDRETIEIVLEAAETGHLVLSSLNTMDDAQNRGAHRQLRCSPDETATGSRAVRQVVPLHCMPTTPAQDRSQRADPGRSEILKANAAHS